MKMFLLIAILGAGAFAFQNAQAADAAKCQALEAKLEELWNKYEKACQKNAKSKECLSADEALEKAETEFEKAGCDLGDDDSGDEDSGDDEGGAGDDGSDEGADDDAG